MSFSKVFSATAAIVLVWAGVVSSLDAENRGAFSFQLENDLFARSDRYYTNGMKLSWTSMDPMSGNSEAGVRKALSLCFGQNIYTPSDIRREDLIPEDRPYAGISYFALAFHRQRGDVLDTLEFTVGIVGPRSYAEQAQRFIHDVFNGIEPKGWSHQLRDELALGIMGDRKWKPLRWGGGNGFGLDMIGHLGAGLGNVITAANAGWEIRLGYNLPRDFGTYLIRPGGESSAFFIEHSGEGKRKGAFGLHAFLYVGGHAVLRNIFLDGNTFGGSHRVDKLPFVADAAGGLVMIFRQVKLSYAYVLRSRQFRTQQRPHVFGAVCLSFSY